MPDEPTPAPDPGTPPGDPCEVCRGTKRVWVQRRGRTSRETCPRCEGTGVEPEDRRTPPTRVGGVFVASRRSTLPTETTRTAFASHAA
jgi:hypothetical protein